MSTGYVQSMTMAASVEHVFDAVSTVAGVRGWWTPIVTGSAAPGGQLWLGFEGLDEAIVLRVDEASRPGEVSWTCVRHTSAPEWDGSRIRFDIDPANDGRSQVTLSHSGVDPALVAPGWARFTDSLRRSVEVGSGRPYVATTTTSPLDVAREYYTAWTTGDHGHVRTLLADDLVADVPINEYANGDEFAAAVQRFASLAERVELLSEFASGADALLVYDMHTEPLGVLRVAEQLTIAGGLIQRIRHIHDTAALRSGDA
jgi:hypothetical protein